MKTKNLLAVIIISTFSANNIQTQNIDFDNNYYFSYKMPNADLNALKIPTPHMYSNDNNIRWLSNNGVIWNCTKKELDKINCLGWESNEGKSLLCNNESLDGKCLAWKAGKSFKMDTIITSKDIQLPIFLRENFYLISPKRLAENNDILKENDWEWINCSKKDEEWQSTEEEWRTMSQDHNDIYICRYIVTYNCGWKNCFEPNPHTAPNQCTCKMYCKNKVKATNECKWIPSEQ